MYKYPQKNKTYSVGSDVYVYVDAQNHKYIEYAELYLNGKKIRKEANYPYEWCKGGGSSDGYLRNLKPGTYKLECKIKDKCGKYKTITNVFYVKGEGGGGNGKCEFDAWYVYPKRMLAINQERMCMCTLMPKTIRILESRFIPKR